MTPVQSQDSLGGVHAPREGGIPRWFRATFTR